MVGELGLAQGILDKQAIKFREHWQAEGGQKASKVNWDLAFRTWMRNYVEWSAKPAPAHKNGNKGLSPRELIKAADHMAASGSDVHDAFSYIKGTK